MATVIKTMLYRCLNDCVQSGCPGHTMKLTYQSTSDHYTFNFKNKEYEFDANEMQEVVYMLQSLALDRADSVRI